MFECMQLDLAPILIKFYFGSPFVEWMASLNKVGG